MDKTRRRFFLFLLPVCVLFLLVHHHVTLIARGTLPFGSLRVSHPDSPPESYHGTVNSTLGFGALVAVSHAASPRREGLLWSAKLTGIDITIPEQPQWTDGHLQAFKSPQGSRITRGSALAWMGHLNALRWFLSTPLQTALILEDDVDFSLHLQSQIAPAARALRTLLAPGTPRTPNASLDTDPLFWANQDSWDILWLGHCNDAASPHHVLSHPSISYPDPHMPPLDAIAPPASDLLKTFDLSHTRMLYRSHWPLCTFAYAVTRASAQRILSTYGTEGEAGCVAFDVRMLEACRDHDWRCWTVAPELFHHVPGKSEIASVDTGVEKDGEGDRSGRRRPSVNIECGARNEWLWVGEGDEVARERMLGRVREASARGECFVKRMRGKGETETEV
ncbi:glycosyltransferase family 25 protein [Karstenula rhodostoma CBS 690.94]|uniref:Glycosyltransferase family 25 protein n=1 Tax=Karstenula rhodostoma CBS 690.94 TaxID=1392251 RepID=A0A9P4PSL1_9PLEO|nr:glycosyltransferase family 25 protein [Karstenula rhodostoma CBS 690.94]